MYNENTCKRALNIMPHICASVLQAIGLFCRLVFTCAIKVTASEHPHPHLVERRP